MEKSRIIRTSLIASLAVLLLPILLSLAIIIKPDLHASDDTPARAAGMILFTLIPVLYIVIAVAMALGAFVYHPCRD